MNVLLQSTYKQSMSERIYTILQILFPRIQSGATQTTEFINGAVREADLVCCSSSFGPSLKLACMKENEKKQNATQ